MTKLRPSNWFIFGGECKNQEIRWFSITPCPDNFLTTTQSYKGAVLLLHLQLPYWGTTPTTPWPHRATLWDFFVDTRGKLTSRRWLRWDWSCGQSLTWFHGFNYWRSDSSYLKSFHCRIPGHPGSLVGGKGQVMRSYHNSYGLGGSS